MFGLEIATVKIILEIIVALAAIIGIPWAIVQYLHRYKQKALYFTNCHLIHKSLWESYPNLKNSDMSHTFTPLILMPRSHMNLVNWKNGDDLIIKFIKVDGNLFFVQTKMFWLPDKEPWCKFKHPCISLVLRRYLGIERPMLGADDTVTTGWHEVLHPKEDLDPLHRIVDANGNMKWQCNDAYSHRFWLQHDKVDEYKDSYVEGSFLEYCGLSIELRKKSFLINKELS